MHHTNYNDGNSERAKTLKLYITIQKYYAVPMLLPVSEFNFYGFSRLYKDSSGHLQ